MIYNRIEENFDSIIDTSGGYNKVYSGENLVWEKVLGNFLLYDVERQELFLTDFPLTYPKELFIPVAIVVIPFSHNRYGTGEAGLISLRNASRTTPKEGQLGVYQAAVGLTNKPKVFYPNVACLGYFSDSTVSPVLTKELDIGTENGFIPYNNAAYVDSYRWKECPTDPDIYWRRPSSISGKAYAPSPFLIHGGCNRLYGATTSPATTRNALSDFRGKENCEELLQYCTSYDESWKTADTIPGTSGTTTWSPAMTACWRYSPVGTTEGDWYLPSAGEAGYIGARWDCINRWITALADHFEVELAKLTGGYPLWTSTYYSTSYGIKHDTYGALARQSTTTGHAVRPFTRGRWKGRKEYTPKKDN